MAALVLGGTGMIGSQVVARLVDRGDHVRVGSRSGSAPVGGEGVRVEATDASAIATAAAGADTIYVCASPPYPQWTTVWPQIYAAVEDAAVRTGALLVLAGNLYSYGAVRTPMTEDTPPNPVERKGETRRAGWERLRAADEAGRIRAIEVRASDYFGPGAGSSTHLGSGFFGPLLAGRTASVVGDPDAVHSWAYLPDFGDTLVAAADAATQTGTGRVWHVPAVALSRIAIANQLRDRYGATGRVRRIPDPVLSLIGLVNPLVREVAASRYQFTDTFVSASAATEAALGVRATPWDESLETTVRSYR